MSYQSKVLWVDEEQDDMMAIALIVARCGAELLKALSIKEALEILARSDPDAIILDAIVRTGMSQEDMPSYAGVLVWRRLTPDQRKRTICLSVVPPDRIREQVGLPEEMVFWKQSVGDNLSAFQQRLQGVLNARMKQDAGNQGE